ncbi:MAG: fatty acid desaturase, partial [Emcibacteraceae bacterium]|nr:fatty acid desaturase [Emcibacteraceae bacterium]
RNPLIYWADLLLNLLLGWGCFYLVVTTDFFTTPNTIAFLVSSFALYRAAIFVHEIVHFKKGSFKSFVTFWNLTAGFPLLIPSFTYYGVHNDHHKRDTYGTTEDGEYLPFGAEEGWKIIAYVFLSLILPFLFLARFLILTPLSWLIPPLGRYAWERASSLTIDLAYRRPPPTKLDGKYWRVQEIGATLYAWAGALLIYNGTFPIKVLIVWYLTTLLVFTMNSLRTLGAHAYRNPGDVKMSVPDQFLDSVDVTGGILSPFWAPVGLRYHATHHLFPQMPYHNLGTAHDLLVKDLSDNSLYLSATRKNLWHALSTLWEDSALSQKKD